MARSTRARRRFLAHQYRASPYPLPSCRQKDVGQEMNPKNSSKVLDKKDWEDVTCSVCMEVPHNAVLLLCSSHDKGCRPYMCGTSYRYSNCLNQFKKAYTKVLSPPAGQAGFQDGLWHGSFESMSSESGYVWPDEKHEVTELACPLCRGQVKGWTVVEAARQYFNAKKRSCTQDDCSFVGTYRELRKHVRVEHPSARPREVDPTLEQKWRTLEWESERNDVLSTIMTPGSMVWGDYVIEGGLHHLYHDFEIDNDDDEDDESEMDDVAESGIGPGDANIFDDFFSLLAFMSAGDVSFRSRLRRAQGGFLRMDDGGEGAGVPIIDDPTLPATPGENDPPAQGRHVLGVGRSARRHRRRRQRERL